jgi:protein-disulfide isomerase
MCNIQRNKQMKLYLTLLLLVLAAPSQAFAGAHDHKGHKHSTSGKNITSPELLTQELAGDIVYGSKDAPVTMIEYASLSCSHCAKFYQSPFQKLKTDFVSKDKVRIIYRHYPLNAPALQAALLVECAADNDKKQALVDTLFNTQANWAFSKDASESLGGIATSHNINEADFKACLANKETSDKILELQLKAQKGLSISSTPTIFINGVVSESKSYEELSNYIDGLLK